MAKDFETDDDSHDRVCYIFFVAGNAIPDRLATDGLERFRGEELLAAKSALSRARLAYHEPGEKLFYRWRWMRVVRCGA